MRRMLRTKHLVRRMHACETMGATTVICTDKTGTLTQNQMQVYQTRFFGVAQHSRLSDDSRNSITDQQDEDDAMNQLIVEGMAVNSIAQLDTSPDGKVEVLGSPTEGALLLWLREKGYDYTSLRESVTILERKMMATVVTHGDNHVLYVKGAPEIVLGLCSSVSGSVSKPEIADILLQYQAQAMRTLGFAYQVVEDGEVVMGTGITVRLQANDDIGSVRFVKSPANAYYKLPENIFTPPSGKDFVGWKINDKIYLPGEDHGYQRYPHISIYFLT